MRPDCDLGNLPKFYSLEQYGASKDKEIALWKKEINRLVKVVNSGKPHHIQGDEQWFGEADATGYARLDHLTMQIEHAWMICDLDNELIALDHAPDLAAMQKIMSIEQHLRRDYDVNAQKIRYKRPLRLDRFNDERYHALVDHLTANLAQVLARLASGKFWEENFIVALAKLSAKLKWLILAYDLPRSVSTVISTKMETMEILKADGRLPPSSVPASEARGKGGDAKEESEGHEHGNKALAGQNINGKGNRYFVVQMAFHNLLSHLCKTSLDQLASNEETGIASDVFETSVVIYDTGYLGRRAMMCGLRDGGIGALGDLNTLHATQAAVQVCGDLFKETTDENPPPTTPPASGTSGRKDPETSPSTTLYWHWDELDTGGPRVGAGGSINVLPGREPYKGQRRFYQMKAVINVLVPIQMLFGAFASALEDKFIEISTIAPTRDRVVKFLERNFVGTSLIQTSSFQVMRQSLIQEKGSRSVWATHLAQERGLAPRPGIKPQLILEGKLQGIVDEWRVKIQEVEDDRAKLQGWTIDQKSITVPFKPYAWGTLALAATIVISGLLFGFLIGNRIRPVDPFNVTIFFWGFAAFLVLVLKSYKVARWDWRDFLLGKIVCHSVSEIVGVSGIKDQRLLALLLGMSSTMSLEMKGPYHTIFTRKSESGDGLAIDIPLDTKAIAAGGYIFVKVHSLLGPALVGLSLGKWATYDCVYAKGEKDAKDGYICRDFNEFRKLRIGGKSLPSRILCTNALKWHRTVGVYEEDVWFS